MHIVTRRLQVIELEKSPAGVTAMAPFGVVMEFLTHDRARHMSAKDELVPGVIYVAYTGLFITGGVPLTAVPTETAFATGGLSVVRVGTSPDGEVLVYFTAFTRLKVEHDAVFLLAISRTDPNDTVTELVRGDPIAPPQLRRLVEGPRAKHFVERPINAMPQPALAPRGVQSEAAAAAAAKKAADAWLNDTATAPVEAPRPADTISSVPAPRSIQI
jgi:hypothetical protein